MKTPPFEPVRFLEQRPQDDPSEVARLIRHAIGAPAKPVPVLKGRIRQTLRRRSASRRRTMRAFLVGGVLFVSGGVVGAVVQPILRFGSRATVESVENVGPVSPGRRTRTAQPTRAAGVLSSDPAPEPADESAPSPLPTGEALGSPAPSMPAPAPGVEPTVVWEALAPAKAGAASTRALRPRDNPKKSAAASIGVGDSIPPGAEPRPMAISMREPSAASPSVPSLEPAPLLPPAFRASPHPEESTSRPLGRVLPAKASSMTAPPTLPSETSAPAGPPPSEQVLVARAIASLRVQRRPAAALAALDEYESRYPRGSLLAEVARLRAEALLLLGQRGAALDELNRGPVTGTSDEESRLVRGELRASAGRWQEALRDFDPLVAAWSARTSSAAMSPRLQARLERALWGRACARSHLADEAGARADLEELIRRFPQGRFAAQAATRLGGSR